MYHFHNCPNQRINKKKKKSDPEKQGRKEEGSSPSFQSKGKYALGFVLFDFTITGTQLALSEQNPEHV